MFDLNNRLINFSEKTSTISVYGQVNPQLGMGTVVSGREISSWGSSLTRYQQIEIRVFQIKSFT